MPRPEANAHTDAVFNALADPTRRGLIRRLSDDGGLSATELARDLPISRQAVQKHLDALGDAGLVRSRRSGRSVVFELVPAPLENATDWIAGIESSWQTRLASRSERAAKKASTRKPGRGG